MSEFTGDKYGGYDFGRMNRERSSKSNSEPVQQSPKIDTDYRYGLDAATLQGREQLYKSSAEAVIGSVTDIRKQSIREAFIPMLTEHKMETVAVSNGVTWINDSKATNVNSTWFAMESINAPIVWIMGGVDSGNDYTRLAYLVQRKVKSIIILGGGATHSPKLFKSCGYGNTHLQHGRGCQDGSALCKQWRHGIAFPIVP